MFWLAFKNSHLAPNPPGLMCVPDTYCMPANITTAKNVCQKVEKNTKENCMGFSVKDNNIPFDAGVIIIKFFFEFLQ